VVVVEAPEGNPGCLHDAGGGVEHDGEIQSAPGEGGPPGAPREVHQDEEAMTETYRGLFDGGHESERAAGSVVDARAELSTSGTPPIDACGGAVLRIGFRIQ